MSHSFHHTVKWKKLRKTFAILNPLCKMCKDTNIIKPVDEVDHIIPVSQKPDLFFDWLNLQSLCRSCHEKKTASENSTLPDKLIIEREKWDESFKNEYKSD